MGDDSAQPYANGNVLNTFKADQAKPCCSAGQRHQMHFLNYDI